MTSSFAKPLRWLCPLLLSGAMTTTTVLAQPAPIFCNGSGRLFTTDVSGQSRGVYSTIPGSATSDAVTVEVVECGRAIRVWVPSQGRTLHLVQATLDDFQYTDTLEIQGFNATFSMFRSTPHRLQGTYTVNTRDADLYAEVTIEVTDAQAPNMAGCADDPEPEFTPRGISMSHAALADALTSTGRTLPAESNYGDYISAEPDAASGTQIVYVRLGANGDILPSTTPARSIADICAGRANTTEPPVEFLRFKVFTFERTTAVFVQRVEIDTGRIIEQREGIASGENQSSAKIAMLFAMSELTVKPGNFALIER